MPFSTITILQPDLSQTTDVNASLYGAVANVDAISNQSATGFTGYAGAIAVDFIGTGLTYDGATGAVTGGTLTSFTLRDFDGHMTSMVFTPGVSATALMNASASQLADIFKNYSTTFHGHDGKESFSGGKFDDTLRGGNGLDTLLGGAGNDLVVSDATGDTLDGGDGIDTVSYAGAAAKITLDLSNTAAQGGLGGDTILNFENAIGSDFSDQITGSKADNVIEGGKGNDTLAGAGGNDVIRGGEGDDIIAGGAGADIMDGGAGVDGVNYSSLATGFNVTVTLGAAGVQTVVTGTAGSDAIGDKLANFESVFGGAGNDKLTGNAEANALHGGAGNDILNGGTGNDSLLGHDGDDIVESGAGADQMQGGDGIDTLSYAGSAEGVTIDPNNTAHKGGDAVGDMIVSGFEILVGSAKDDALAALGGSNNVTTIDGGAGNDTISGSDLTEDKLNGGAGDDVIEGGAGADTLEGNAGLDTLSYAKETGSVTVRLLGAFAADVGSNAGTGAEGDVATGFENLRGGEANDKLTGDNGNNVIEGGAGKDVLDGGGGIDTLSYEHSSMGVIVQLSATTQTGAGGDAEGDTTTGFENLVGSAKGDVVFGSAAANRIDAGGGNDEIVADLGADSYDGGAGNDFINYGNLAPGEAITVTLGAGGAETTVIAKAGSIAAGDKIKNIEHVVGGAGNDVLTGNAGDNALEGLDGDDTISGGAGKDLMYGGAEGAAGDTLTYASSKYGVTVDLDFGAGMAQVVQAGDASGDRIDGFENLIGTAKNDILRGTNDTNKILGGAGDDLIEGRGMNAADLFELLDGGTGNDTVSYQSSAMGVTANLSNQGTKMLLSGGDAKGDALLGFENMIGSSKSDTLVGNKGNNILEGGADADILSGGAGIDTLSYAGSAAGVEVQLADDGKILTAANGDANGDFGDGFENITGSAKGDVLAGNKLANLLTGGAGDDQLGGQGGKDVVRGGDGNDTLFGGKDAETLDGGADGDTIVGSAGADVLDGGTGFDFLYYFAGVGTSITLAMGEPGKQTTVTATAKSDAAGDKIVNFEHFVGVGAAQFVITGNSLHNALAGGDGNDVLKGLAGDDELLGNDGDDIIEGGEGEDTLEGGKGIDTLSYAGSKGGVFAGVDFAGFGGDANGDTVSGFENLIGTSKSDFLVGSAVKNVIAGGGGEDFIAGLGDADTLDGGSGVDTVAYFDSSAGVTVDLTLQSTKTAQTSPGDANGDVLTGFEWIDGSSYDDKLTGDAGNNTVDGGNGNDSISGGNGNDTLDGDDGNDSISGGKGNDTLYGDEDNDTIDGGDGDDVVEGGSGNDKMSGGSGFDTLSYADTSMGVTVYLGGGSVGGDAEGDENTGFENLIGGFGDDALAGDDLANSISGGYGNDMVIGSKGADTLDGGVDVDLLLYTTTATESVTVTLGEANVQTNVTATAGSEAAGDKIKNFEDFGGSGAGKYTVTGNSGANSIATDSGNDVIKGLGGDDFLNGEDGDDWIEGGAGNDELLGGDNTAAGDTLSYKASSLGVMVDLGTGLAKGGDASGDTFDGFENLIGSDKDDVLGGDDEVNKIEGGLGNDTIRGGDGADVLIGGTGVNTLSYESTGDGVTIPFHSVTVTLVAGKQAIVSGGDAAGDIATGFQNLIGSSTNDKLTGDTGNNVIEGGAGADILAGGGGIDTLSYAHDTKGVTVILYANQADGGDAKGDTITGFTHVIGGSGNDVFIGSSASNILTGGAGDDELFGGDGNDVLDGGDGLDTAHPADTIDPVKIDLAAGISKFGTRLVTLQSIELVFGSDGSDTFSALGFNAASKNAGSIGIANRAGTFNRFEGLFGDDKILGNGDTQVSYEHASAAVTVDLGAGTAAGDESVGKDTILGGVVSVRGSNFGDKLFGSDILDTETFQGLGGNDTIDGNGGLDVADYSPTTGGGVSVDLAAGTVTGLAAANSGNDGLQQIEGVRGTEFADTFSAAGFDGTSTNAGDFATYNEFEGGGGNDTITGNGNTAVVFDHANTGVTVDLAAGKVTASGANNIGTDTITGGVTQVRGSQFGDVIKGGDGVADVLDGGLGDDTLTGGVGGNDTYVYSIGLSGPFTGGGHDTIVDWHAGRKIDLGGVAGVQTYDDVHAKMTQVGGNVLIDFGGGNVLTIMDTPIADLDAHQSDFLLS